MCAFRIQSNVFCAFLKMMSYRFFVHFQDTIKDFRAPLRMISYMPLCKFMIAARFLCSFENDICRFLCPCRIVCRFLCSFEKDIYRFLGTFKIASRIFLHSLE